MRVSRSPTASPPTPSPQRGEGKGLVACGIVKRFGNRTVLEDVDIELRPGESVALLGPSGSGKSTLLNILGTLEPPNAGTVRLGDLDVLSLRKRELGQFRSTRIGFVFQEHHLLPQLTALENVLLPTLASKSTTVDAMDLLGSLGLQDRANQLPAQLSGGERQRVAVARALVNDPGILLCDEPTGSLDHAAGDALVSILLDQAKNGKAVLVVTHNEEQAARFSRVLRLRDGRILG